MSFKTVGFTALFQLQNQNLSSKHFCYDLLNCQGTNRIRHLLSSLCFTVSTFLVHTSFLSLSFGQLLSLSVGEVSLCVEGEQRWSMSKQWIIEQAIIVMTSTVGYINMQGARVSSKKRPITPIVTWKAKALSMPVNLSMYAWHMVHGWMDAWHKTVLVLVKQQLINRFCGLLKTEMHDYHAN